MASLGPSSLLAQQQALASRRRVQHVPPGRPLPRGARVMASVRSGLEARAPESAFVTAVSVVEKQEEELLLPLPHLESAIDDPSLHNPLLRATRLSTSWFGVVLEWEGVIVQSAGAEHLQAWLQVADTLGYKRPLGQSQTRIKGVRDEVIVQRIFGWTHNPAMIRQIVAKKAEVLAELLGGRQPVAMLEARPFLELCKRNGVPIALAAPLPEAKVEEALSRLALRHYFDAVVTAEDAGTAEMEFYFALGAQKLGRPPLRCIVVGESNASVEASHELGMKSIIVSGNNPVYEFASSDLVVRNLTQLSFMNLRKLFGAEELVAPRIVIDEDGNAINPQGQGQRSGGGFSSADDEFRGAPAGGMLRRVDEDEDEDDDIFGFRDEEDEEDDYSEPGSFGRPLGGVMGRGGAGLPYQ